MKSKVVFFLTVVVLLVLLSIGKCQSEEWIPYVPFPQSVDLKFWTFDGISYIYVSVTFSCAGYKISDWGTPVREKYEMWVDSVVWEWKGPSAQVITTLFHTYDLGRLEEGNYIFTFMAWNVRVKSINFSIVRADITIPDLNDDGIVDMFDLKTVAKALYSYPGNPNWNPYADLNQDGIIDVFDLRKIAKHYLEHI